MTDPGTYYAPAAIRDAIAGKTSIKRMILDVCGTLYAENTTVALLEQVCTRGGLHARRVHAWHLVAAIGRRLGVLSPAAYMRTRVKGLRGIPHDTIAAAARELVSEHLTKRDVPFELLDLAKQEGIPFGYATYTLGEIVEAIQERLGGAALCYSELAYDDSGRCTGRYKRALHGERKEACIPDDWKPHLRQTCFITDDGCADESLLRAVGYPLLMAPNRETPREPTWTASIPGMYYYRSRYRYAFERVIHLFKYWGTYALVFWLTSSEPLQPECALLALVAWMAVYDIGCKLNDVVASSEACGTERYGDSRGAGSLRFIVIRLAWVAACLLVLGLRNPMAALLMGGLLLALACVFALHNRLAPKNRAATFYLLYLLKGAVLPAGTMVLPPARYTAFCALFAMTYVPKYALSKRAQTRDAAAAIRDKPILQPILGKNVTLLLLSLFDIRFVPALIWVDLTTAIELGFRRCAGHKETRDNE